MREYILFAMERTASRIAESAGASAEFWVAPDGNPPVINDAALTERMLPVLRKVVGDVPLEAGKPQTVAEDFSAFSERVPGLYLHLGTVPGGMDAETAPSNHSPLFDINEADMELGVRAFAHMVVTYLQSE
jgi:amidohydrolase